MDNEKLVRTWQANIVGECRRILGRDLTAAESAFVESRTAFVALEMIEDHVRSLTGKPDELQRYLRSEERVI
jgi:hypothetical protein